MLAELEPESIRTWIASLTRTRKPVNVRSAVRGLKVLIRDAELKPKISEVHEENFEVYGVRKVWRQLPRDDVDVGRDRVARLMGELGLCGATRTKRFRTTYPAPVSDRPADLVERVFTASAPDQLWVADLTCVWTPKVSRCWSM